MKNRTHQSIEAPTHQQANASEHQRTKAFHINTVSKHQILLKMRRKNAKKSQNCPGVAARQQGIINASKHEISKQKNSNEF